MNEKYTKALEIYRKHNKNTDESNKIIAEKITEFSTRKDILDYLEQSKIKPLWLEIKAFNLPIVVLVIGLLIGKSLNFLIEYFIQDMHLSLGLNLGIKTLTLIPTLVLAKYLIKSIFSKNEGFRDLCMDIILENKVYNIDYSKVSSDSENKHELLIAQSGTGQSLLESIVFSKENIIVQHGNLLFSMFSFVWMFRVLLKPLEVGSWFLFCLMLLTLPFALYHAADNKMRHRIKNKLGANAIFMFFFGNMYNWYYNRKITSLEGDIRALKSIESDTHSFEMLLETYKSKLF